MSAWPTDVPIVPHDPAATPRVDLVIAGAGPSGLAVGERVARAGFSVAIIDPAPLGVWPNNYGVWVDEFEAMGLGDCLEVIWPKATVYLDSDDLGQK
jgi:lycopene beta-cyclase